MTYPIHEVVDCDRYEPLGTRDKFWYRAQDGNQWLFKAGRPGTGENWSEKVTSELAKLMGVPCARYELAKWIKEDGVVSPSFVPPQAHLTLGNELLARDVPNYDLTETYRARDYRLATVFAILRRSTDVKPPIESKDEVSQMRVLEVFAGYLVFDCWIGNPDRHHENWGYVVTSELAIHLAPTFDHASGLGVRLLNQKRHERLSTKDRGFSVESYVQKAKTPFRDSIGENLYTLNVVREVSKIDPGAISYWLKRIFEISRDQIEALFRFMPDGTISDVEIEFALQVLEANKRRMEEFL